MSFVIKKGRLVSVLADFRRSEQDVCGVVGTDLNPAAVVSLAFPPVVI